MKVSTFVYTEEKYSLAPEFGDDDELEHLNRVNDDRVLYMVTIMVGSPFWVYDNRLFLLTLWASYSVN